jgi:uncharacterized Fe-S center protein
MSTQNDFNFDIETPANVWFIPLNDEETDESLAEKTRKVMDAAGMAELIHKKKIAAIKQHFGEEGNKGYIKPEVTKVLIDMVTAKNGFPLLVETNTLYHGRRSDTYNHLMLAYEHGFSLENLGAPVAILDGIHGQNQHTVSIPGKHFDEVHMVTDIPFFDSMLILSHVKGHMVMGIGGAIKNLGMGFASRAGKLEQHSDFQPKVDADKCTRCGLCVKYCPANAIIQSGDDAAEVDLEKCIGCGECFTVCRFGAISFSWASGSKLQEKMAEHAFGAIIGHNKRVGYVNLMNHITKQCDCWGGDNPVLFDNVGIFAGYDPVAIDTACQDVAKERLGKDVFKEMWPEIDATVQLKHGEAIGMGTQEYKLIEVE